MQNKRSAKYFLENEKYTDCSFLLGSPSEQILIKSHKIVLAMASNVFESMLYGNWAENDEKKPIEVTDVEPSAFKAMLKFIYTGDLKSVITDGIIPVQVCAIYYAAEKYQIAEELCNACSEFLNKNINPNTACTIYEFSKLVELPSLQVNCMKMITSRTKDVFNSSGWCDVEFQTLLDILDQEELQINSEIELFNAIAIYFASFSNEQEETTNEKNKIQAKDENGVIDDVTSEESKSHEEEMVNNTDNPKQSNFVLNLSDDDAENLKRALTKIADPNKKKMSYYMYDFNGRQVPMPNFEQQNKETKASVAELEKEQNILKRQLEAMKEEQERMRNELEIDRSSTSVLYKIQRSAKYFLLNEKHTDCSFLVGAHPNQILLKAHRLILAMASDVFHTMLYNSDSTESMDEPIEITDIQAVAFKDILKYIYSMDIKVITDKITPAQACALHHAAQKFQLPSELSASCVAFLKENIYPSNVCSIYEYSKFIGLPVIEEKCTKMIISRTTDVFNSPEWCNIDVLTLFYILDQDTLKIKSEVDLFNAVVIYFLSLSATESKDAKENLAKIESKKDPNKSSEIDSVETEVSGPPQKVVLNLSGQNQKNFRKALKKIRFLTMTASEFAEGPYESGILEKESSVILSIISKGRSDLLSYPVNFSRSISKRFK